MKHLVLIALTWAASAAMAADSVVSEKTISFAMNPAQLSQQAVQSHLALMEDVRDARGSALRGVQELGVDVVKNTTTSIVIAKAAINIPVKAGQPVNAAKKIPALDSKAFWTTAVLGVVVPTNKFSDDGQGGTIVRFPVQDPVGQALFGDMEAHYAVESYDANDVNYARTMDRFGDIVKEAKPSLIVVQRYTSFKSFVNDSYLYNFLYKAADGTVNMITLSANTPTAAALTAIKARALVKFTTATAVLTNGMNLETVKFRNNVAAASK